MYGAEAGNLALRAVATGGVYIGGGIAQHVLPRMESGLFRTAFETKQGFSNLLHTIPTWLITHPNPGLLGAAIAAQWDLAVLKQGGGMRSVRNNGLRVKATKRSGPGRTKGHEPRVPQGRRRTGHRG